MSSTEGGSGSSLGEERFAMLMASIEKMSIALTKLATKEEVAGVTQQVAKLATKEELAKEVSSVRTEVGKDVGAVSSQIARLATKDELKDAVAKLATKEEVDELSERLRRVQRDVKNMDDDLARVRRAALPASIHTPDSVSIQPMFMGGGAIGGPPELTSRSRGGPPPWPCAEEDLEY